MDILKIEQDDVKYSLPQWPDTNRDPGKFLSN
jgi:hypothetical protein